MEYYNEDNSNSMNERSESGVSVQYEEVTDEDYLRYHKEQIFSDIDYTKRKVKIACTLG
jgi:hypothetical protein